MIVNALRFGFREDLSTAARSEALEAFRTTGSLAPVSFSCVGQDLGNPADGFTHAFLVGIANLAALERYLSDPRHRAGAFVILPRLSRTSLSDDGDPTRREKIGQVWQRAIPSGSPCSI